MVVFVVVVVAAAMPDAVDEQHVVAVAKPVAAENAHAAVVVVAADAMLAVVAMPAAAVVAAAEDNRVVGNFQKSGVTVYDDFVAVLVDVAPELSFVSPLPPSVSEQLLGPELGPGPVLICSCVPLPAYA